jgi:hypothetical protein
VLMICTRAHEGGCEGGGVQIRGLDESVQVSSLVPPWSNWGKSVTDLTG